MKLDLQELYKQNEYTVTVNDNLRNETFELWRNSLVAASRYFDMIFVASGEIVKVYSQNALLFGEEDIEELFTLKSAFSTTNRRPGRTHTFMEHVINRLSIVCQGTVELLIVLDDSGKVQIYQTDDLNRAPQVYEVSDSAWGLAFSSQRILAVSANSHNIEMFHLGTEYSSKFNDYRSRWFHTSKLVLVGHNHNIPNISFDSTGRYIASVSIDCSLRVWDLYELHSCAVFYSYLCGWGVCFLEDNDFQKLDLKSMTEAKIQTAKNYGSSAPSITTEQDYISFYSRENEFDDTIFEGDHNVLLDENLHNVEDFFLASLTEEPDALLLYATHRTVTLLAFINGNRLMPLASSKNMFENPLDSRTDVFQRVNMIEKIPGLHCVVCVSQSGQITILHLVSTIIMRKEKQYRSWSFVPQLIHLTHVVDSPIIGLSVSPVYHGQEDMFLRFYIILVTYSGKVITIEIKRTASAVDPLHLSHIIL
ncbi:WD repeat protein [Schizosaccharomyces japonicus yFS275]|uniref:WD repeat protein n=1 Tax=Schizosaccharomyces japonicus (strain yFS275 / FY16936) TaxID=402676 RepID=B6K4F1_SCHJY|nr:WD repeat protein [Schizosaccharomyces japonicus yFS275]EEB08358.2 WD repeat protein [Schizosaccharomyces japonicus yFS275]